MSCNRKSNVKWKSKSKFVIQWAWEKGLLAAPSFCPGCWAQILLLPVMSLDGCWCPSLCPCWKTGRTLIKTITDFSLKECQIVENNFFYKMDKCWMEENDVKQFFRSKYHLCRFWDLWAKRLYWIKNYFVFIMLLLFFCKKITQDIKENEHLNK